MPKTAVQTAACDICGAEVRDGSIFCYNCGGSLTTAAEPEPIRSPPEPVVPDVESAANGLATRVDELPAKRKAEGSVRRKVNREPVEIVWEPREGVSWAFVVASIVVVIIALAVVVAAVYVR